jgi:RecG-like helicase
MVDLINRGYDMYNWTTSIRYVKGLGPTRSRELIKIGIETVGDLLCRQPLSYIYPGVTSIAEAGEGMVVIKAKIRSVGRTYYGMEAILSDDTGEKGSTCRASWYSTPCAIHALRSGVTATFWGKMKGGVMQQPK